MLISVIIPTRNRANLLRKTLNSLVDQTLGKHDFEVIVVDNGSTDDTKTVCDSFSNSLDLVYLFEPRPGLHEGRHAGLKAARTEFLAYADDDIIAFPEWLDTVVKVFHSDQSIALVGGKVLPEFEVSPPFWVLQRWNEPHLLGQVLGDLSLLDLGDHERDIPPAYVFGCNFSVRKQVVIDAGGFHPDGMPFELIRFRGDGETYISHFVEQKGYRARYHPGASVFHMVTKERMVEDYFFKRRYIQGISDAYTHLRHGSAREIPAASNNRFITLLKIFSGVELLRQINTLRKENLMSEMEKGLKSSYEKGYSYLVDQYNKDAEVRAWVHKETYLT